VEGADGNIIGASGGYVEEKTSYAVCCQPWLFWDRDRFKCTTILWTGRAGFLGTAESITTTVRDGRVDATSNSVATIGCAVILVVTIHGLMVADSGNTVPQIQSTGVAI
jgi:hypothetical protein